MEKDVSEMIEEVGLKQEYFTTYKTIRTGVPPAWLKDKRLTELDRKKKHMEKWEELILMQY